MKPEKKKLKKIKMSDTLRTQHMLLHRNNHIKYIEQEINFYHENVVVLQTEFKKFVDMNIVKLPSNRIFEKYVLAMLEKEVITPFRGMLLPAEIDLAKLNCIMRLTMNGYIEAVVNELLTKKVTKLPSNLFKCKTLEALVRANLEKVKVNNFIGNVNNGRIVSNNPNNNENIIIQQKKRKNLIFSSLQDIKKIKLNEMFKKIVGEDDNKNKKSKNDLQIQEQHVETEQNYQQLQIKEQQQQQQQRRKFMNFGKRIVAARFFLSQNANQKKGCNVTIIQDKNNNNNCVINDFVVPQYLAGSILDIKLLDDEKSLMYTKVNTNQKKKETLPLLRLGFMG